MDFKDKVVIITGASSGIGAETALHFAKLNAKIAIAARSGDKLKAFAHQILDMKKMRPLVIKADVTEDSGCRKIIEETVQEFGQIDILVNNAGLGVYGKMSAGIEHFDKVINTNLRSAFLLTTLAMPYLIKTKGNIVNISSVVSTKVYPNFTAYSVSKAGMDMLTKSSAFELAEHGVRVNSVNPGLTQTNFIATALGVDEKTQDQIYEKRKATTALGKLCKSEEIADLIVFLASDKAKSITGSVNFIDNGELLY